ncbi:MAG: LTA synthase family protein, partial [Lachnospiraceae bacterium]|nr:LTA synthase family protein [Lachnospiraceae bacterium]
KRIGLYCGSVIWLTLMYCVLFGTSYISILDMTIDMWDSKTSSEQYGTVLAFLAYGNSMKVEKPENYSVSEIEEEATKYKMEEGSDEETPNIIVVMNESFSDLSYLGDLETNVPYLEFFNSLEENTIKGHVVVSIMGGGTPNSEFEFLTGHSLAFLSNSIPYIQYIQSSHINMTSNLKSQGYSTTAIHLMQEVNWRRNVVYPYLGFDDFISIEDVDLENEELVRNYISDSATYKHVLDLLNNKDDDEKIFVFDVTGQNHGGYTYAGTDFETEVEVIGFDSSEVNQYLTLIRKSDQALEGLIEELEEYEEPVLLVFYGDHYPGLSEEFFDWIKSDDEDDFDFFQKEFTVPFLIWANYDIEEQENVYTSLNYLGAYVQQIAGLDLSGYDEFRLELSETIPAMNAYGYQDQNGVWYNYDEDNDDVYSTLLDQYWKLEYNELFETKKKVVSFFETAAN